MLSGWIFATKAFIDNWKEVVNKQYLLHVSPQYGELRPTNAWDRRFGSSRQPSKFHGFRVLTSLLQRRRSPEANQTLHDIRPSPMLLHYLYIFGSSCRLTEFRHLQNALCVQVFAFSYIGSVTARHTSQTLRRGIQGMELRNFCRGSHLYSAGRPSRWTLAHILVFNIY